MKSVPVLACALCFFLAVPGLDSETRVPSPQQSTKPYAYEVASVKPYKAYGSSNIFIDSNTHSFTANISVAMLLKYAFGVLMPDELSGIPGWAQDEQYAVEAKMDASTTAQLDNLPPDQQQQEFRLMLRQLLVQRFGLQFHHASKELRVYNLVIARGGVKLKKSQASSQTDFVMGQDHLRGKGVAMWNLVRTLSSITGRLVVNKTGLTGRYDVALNWTPDMGTENPQQNGPSIFTAVQEQLGMKLESAKEPIDTIVVDRIEKPSED